MLKVNNKDTSATPMASVSIVNSEQVNAGWDLSNRKFIISMENGYLDKASITCGVPQGSILGPLLFLIVSTTCHKLQIVNFYYIPMILVWFSKIGI